MIVKFSDLSFGVKMNRLTPTVLVLLVLSFSSWTVDSQEANLDTFLGGWSSILDRFNSMRDDLIHRRHTIPGRSAYEKEGESLSNSGSSAVESSEGTTGEQEFNPEIVVVDKGTGEPSREPITPNWPFRGITNPWIWKGIDSILIPRRPWWKGPNVCIERQVAEETPDSNDANKTEGFSSLIPFTLQSTQCMESETAYSCVTKIRSPKESKTSTIKYQCCHGSRRIEPTGQCVEVDLKNITATLKEIGAAKMESVFSRSTLPLLRADSRENVTIFSPTDEEMMDYEDDKNKQSNEIPASGDDTKDVEPKEADTNDLVSHHIVNGLYKTGDFHNNMVLSTVNNESTIRINVYHYPEKMITANCAPITMPNNFASNAVIHLVGRVIPKPTSTILSLIENDPRFTIFMSLVKQSNLSNELADPDKTITLLAPTDDAFQKLDPSVLSRLQNGGSCYNVVLENHVIPNIICSSAITTMYWHRSQANNRIVLTRNEDNKLYVNDVPVEGSELLGTNGLVYPISDVLIPDNAKPVSANLANRFTSHFLKLANESGVISEWDSMDNITIIAPTNNAYKKLDENEQNSTTDFGYYVAKNLITQSSFFNNKIIETSNGQKLRLNVIEEIPGLISRATIQCARIVHFNRDVCNGAVIMVDSVIKPAKENIITALESMEGFNLFRALIRNSTFEKKLAEESGPFTVLAVDDASLNQQFTEKELTELTSDPSKVERLLQKHILPEMICCSSIRQAPLLLNFQRFRVMDGSTLNAHRDLHGNVKFWSPVINGMATVKKCDVMADNGAVHVINRAIYGGSNREVNGEPEPHMNHQLGNIPLIIQGFWKV